jgi:hypothetical protein
MLRFCTTRLYWSLIPHYRSLCRRWFDTNDPMTLVTLEWIVEILTLREELGPVFWSGSRVMLSFIDHPVFQESFAKIANWLGSNDLYTATSDVIKLMERYWSQYSTILPISTVKVLNCNSQYAISDPGLTINMIIQLMSFGQTHSIGQVSVMRDPLCIVYYAWESDS